MPRKICFVVGTCSQGGAERQLYYMLRVLRDAGTEVTVLCLTKGEYWEPAIKNLGFAVTWVGQHKARVGRLWRIVNQIAHVRPQIIHSSHFYTNIPAAFAGLLLGIPAIGAVRNDGLSEIAETGRVVGSSILRTPRWIAGNSRAGPQKRSRPRCSREPIAVST